MPGASASGVRTFAGAHADQPMANLEYIAAGRSTFCSDSLLLLHR